jgi:phosphatidylserine/phosphatidylglycerophosphate/cardiolipin synthase-like enzyme
VPSSTHRLRRPIAAFVSAALLVGLAGAVAATPSTAAVSTAASQSPQSVITARAPGAGAPDHYTPPTGVKFNNPLAGEVSRRNIIRHLIRTINSVPKRESIHIASWNVRSDAIINALIRAHVRRKVSVRIVMDRLNANRDNPNFGVNRLERALKIDNGKRKQSRKSFLRKCVSACRAPRGIAHTKFYLFSKAGTARNVVMYGSANATDLAAGFQWNDLYTIRRDASIYGEFDAVFKEMTKDTNVAQPYVAFTHGNFSDYFYPYRGVGTEKDPIMQELNNVVCDGATGNTGTNGHTKIRIAMTSMHGARGIALATRLMQMHNRGCDVKIVYAVFGNEILSIFRNKGPRPMPFRQIAQDFDLDGVYDRYLHMKDMTISGNYGGNTQARVTINGTANWTSVALASDEVVAKIYGGKLMRQYNRWIDFLFAHPPRFTRTEAAFVSARTSALAAAGTPVDPYAKMRAQGVDVPPASDLPTN